jgi:23S rRNA (guanosine2251-2'-O)-methyltransferase
MRAGVRVEERERDELDALAPDDRHQGAVAIAGAYPYLDLDGLLAALPARAPLLVALDEVTDPHNFGAIVRSAVALGADGVITLAHRAAPVTPAVVRASAGATEVARIARVTNLARAIETLVERGMDVVGLDADGGEAVESLRAGDAGIALVVGAEGRGLRRLTREKCTRLAKIALRGPIASLNASVAAGIALEHAARACFAARS